jgi:Ala-tRNA(Pro) deacylase
VAKKTLTDEIVSKLDELHIEYKLMEHEEVTTSADAARVRGVSLGTGAKALLVSADDELYLFVVPGDKRLDWDKAKQVLGAKSIRLATEDELYYQTGLTKGSVPPFGDLLGVKTFVDNGVLDQPLVRFNAGSLVQSLEMPGRALLEAADATPGVFT